MKINNDVHHQIQANGVAKCRALHPICEQLLFAIPNGGSRSKSEGGRLKSEGVVAGVWDLMLAVTTRWVLGQDYIKCPGLIIEVKRPDQRTDARGGLTNSQVAYRDAMAEQGWAIAVVYSTDELYDAVQKHLDADTLFGANLSEADLQCADLQCADLQCADLQCADLQCAALFGADLRQADLREADLSGADLRGAKYDKTTAWPDGVDPVARGAVEIKERK